MFRRRREVTATNQQALDILFRDVSEHQKEVLVSSMKLGIQLFGENNIVQAGRVGVGNYIDTVKVPSWIRYVPFSARFIKWAKAQAQDAFEQFAHDNLDWFKKQ